MIFSWISNKRNKEYFFYKKNKDLVTELKFLGISDDNILNSIRNIPRELFIDQSLIEKAYENVPLPINCLDPVIDTTILYVGLCRGPVESISR